ncbi:MAG: iron hydrogenase [Lachnospiraceae bacterium]|nr:iron hydrogenase [Lachnospiraceae bacterium]
MITLDELYRHYLTEATRSFGEEQLDCLLHPERYAPVVRTGTCTCEAGCSDSQTNQADRSTRHSHSDCCASNPVERTDTKTACQASCLFDAIVKAPDGSLTIDPSRCCGCEACIEACSSGKLTATKDILPVLDALRSAKGPVYALIAPAFIGQFPEHVTPGQLRTAFKAIGFTGMVEVALFADILTLKEAFEFDRNVNSEEDFQLTSCCCPIWIAMIRKVYQELMPHVPGAVSPMIACGRTVKYLHPDAVTVFIGPCLAKKAEAKEPDIADAVDYVLTFQEVQNIFEALNIHPETLAETDREHSSLAGRIYARSGGVSEAVKRTVTQLSPYRSIAVRPKHANGVPDCRRMIEELKAGTLDANFLEGMGCVGGCVGGPKSLIPRDTAKEQVNAYADKAPYQTPLENPYVLELLKHLGYQTVEDFLEKSKLFTREF